MYHYSKFYSNEDQDYYLRRCRIVLNRENEDYCEVLAVMLSDIADRIEKSENYTKDAIINRLRIANSYLHSDLIEITIHYITEKKYN